jgi:hypothetical protein
LQNRKRPNFGPHRSIILHKNGNGRTWVQPFLEAPCRRFVKSEDDGAAPIRGARTHHDFVFFFGAFFFFGMVCFLVVCVEPAAG